MNFLLDTDHLSILQLGQGVEFNRLSPRIAARPVAELGVSIVSLHEQALGCHTYISRAKTAAEVLRGYDLLRRVLADFQAMPVVPFDTAASAVNDQLVRAKIRIGTMDLRIAATALSRGLILLTRNVRHFGQVPGLVTEDWTA